MADGIGLSIGATQLAAVVVGRAAVRRSPVLTLFDHRPPEVGVPSENPNLDERGLIITDFVDRVGDPVAILAADGSSHRGEALTADALRALLYALTRGRPPAEPVAVTHPAHWPPNMVDALRGALAGVAEFGPATPLVSDAAAALTALQADPGLPGRGVIALCDFGGTGTGITLADAANGYRQIGQAVRHRELSGDLIDQALLTRMLADLPPGDSGDLTGTSAIGPLTRLRGQCRGAKERLSTATVTALSAELPGRGGEVRLNRTELDEVLREPLAVFVAALQSTLERNGVHAADLSAVATAGGGARIPLITTTLSENFRVPVVTTAQPELSAAIGGGLTAARGGEEADRTALAPVPVPVPAAEESTESSTFRALAWSAADDVPDVVPAAYDEPDPDPRPQVQFAPDDRDPPPPAPLPWYRRPAVALGIALVAVLAAVAAALYFVRDDDSAPSSTTTTSATTTADAPAPAPAAPPPADTPAPQAPAPQTVTRTAPPPPATQAPPPPPPNTEPPPPPPPETTAPPPPPTTAPPTTAPPPTTQPPLIPTLPYTTIPGLPFVPAPPGLGGQ